ncbi:FAD-dependent oxidoreductase [Micromonospora endolithica]|uniref:FAD-dependent monooxygenase n=1 Tax=Micromonospora endolithica TaxID=230091 RepID=A0A3A9ZR63_9ACTN|nr:NAD(P)/FAD-dependent oxidoreductase [Micromonospora endolithica]RKN50742.1 FAD-dependent monooxygenase [Micromonospora endolithica]TWJ20513.1 2-polyprenyl-6-methoxyphenol hydroxylase-like FAD-dependent oxidoreductase [Micromonospora endolithica]
MRSAVVVGAGIGGLAVAGALARSGWRVTLLERADRVRPEPTAVVLWPNGVRALRALGLGAGLEAIATPLRDGGIRRPDGHWLVQPRPTPADRMPVVVHREDLHDALIAGLGDGVELRTGVTVRTVRAEPGQRPSVGDGRHTLEADLVVGADGTDSEVRRQLAPEAAVVSSGSAAWRAVIPWYQAPRLPGDAPPVGEVLGAGYRFVAASLGERGSSGGSTRGGIYWVATAAGAPRPEPSETQLALLKRWYAGWPAPIADLLDATDPADLVQQEIRELRPLPRSYGFPAGPGGAVLLGDAAHAMPPHLGQGACLAFEDAATLASLLRESRLPDAVSAYDRVRRPRAAAVVRQTRRMSAVLQARGRLALRARDAALGTINSRLLGSAAASAAQWRPPA